MLTHLVNPKWGAKKKKLKEHTTVTILTTMN